MSCLSLPLFFIVSQLPSCIKTQYGEQATCSYMGGGGEVGTKTQEAQNCRIHGSMDVLFLTGNALETHFSGRLFLCGSVHSKTQALMHLAPGLPVLPIRACLITCSKRNSQSTILIHHLVCSFHKCFLPLHSVPSPSFLPPWHPQPSSSQLLG